MTAEAHEPESQPLELTEEELLSGTSEGTQEPVPEFGDGRYVTLYPLSDSEASRVQARALKGLRADADDFDEEGRPKGGRMGMDLGDMAAAQFAADCMAVAFSLGGKWTPEKVGRIRQSGVVERLARRVYEITPGLDRADVQRLEDAAERFRPD